jgi:hypothetical protein
MTKSPLRRTRRVTYVNISSASREKRFGSKSEAFSMRATAMKSPTVAPAAAMCYSTRRSEWSR